MRLAEIAAWVRKYRENPIREPSMSGVPSPGDSEFDRKLRDHNRQRLEYDHGQKCLKAIEQEE